VLCCIGRRDRHRPHRKEKEKEKEKRVKERRGEEVESKEELI